VDSSFCWQKRKLSSNSSSSSSSSSPSCCPDQSDLWSFCCMQLSLLLLLLLHGTACEVYICLLCPCVGFYYLPSCILAVSCHGRKKLVASLALVSQSAE
jgi:hypothetical protein